MNKIIRSAVFLLAITLCLPVFSCTKTADGNKDAQDDETSAFTEVGYETEIQETEPDVFKEHTDNNTVVFCNRFNNIGDPPFTLPDGEPEIGEEGTLYYKNIDQETFDGYVSALESEGFVPAEYYSGTFLEKDDCVIYLFWDTYTYNEKRLAVTWYEKSAFAPSNGITPEEASKLVSHGDSGTSMPLTPIDVTPEGFWELTKGQIFVYPTYASGQYDLYSCGVYYVRGGKAYCSQYRKIAAGDVDADGETEILLLNFGITSGIFTFELRAIDSDEEYSSVFQSSYFKLTFGKINGNPVLLCNESAYGTASYTFDISLDKENKAVLLTPKGEAPEGFRRIGFHRTEHEQ